LGWRPAGCANRRPTAQTRPARWHRSRTPKSDRCPPGRVRIRRDRAQHRAKISLLGAREAALPFAREVAAPLAREVKLPPARERPAPRALGMALPSARPGRAP